MSYIITNGQHYKDIATAIRSKMLTDREYAPSEMASAVANIPSSADGTDEPITGIYFLNPNEQGYPTKVKVVGWSLENKETRFPIVFKDLIFKYLETAEFVNCDFKYLSLSVFAHCPNLQTVTLPNSLTTIVDSAFYNSSLKTITIPNSVTHIEAYAFANCYYLQTITIPNSVTSIVGTSFNSCNSLEFVTLEDGFNVNNLYLSSSTKYSHDTILSWLNALADRTGLTAYTLTIGTTNLAKLTEDEKKIATDKNWNLA